MIAEKANISPSRAKNLAPSIGNPRGSYRPDDWFDLIEAVLRDQVRSFIQAMIEAELEAVLARPRYGRQPKTAPDNSNGAERINSHRHGHRSRSLIGTFGRVEIAMPQARLNTALEPDTAMFGF